MRIPESFKAEFIYARDIVKAGLDATAAVTQTNPGAAPPVSLARASQSALGVAVLGAGIGVLGVYLGRKGRMGNAAFLGCLVGGALGFSSGVAWGTREHTKRYCQTAAHNVQGVRDAHWLEKNPIAYA
jgi:hypothetical protein